MAFDLEKLLRPHISKLQPYSSARDEYSGKFGIFLDANENPFGSMADGDFNRYPDPYQWEIKKKLGRLKSVDTNQIFLGNGSDEAIDLLMRAFCNPGIDNVILLSPTYGMYEVSAGINNIQIKKINLSSTFQLLPDAILDAVDEKTKFIFICSPNNPSGNKLNRNDIKSILNNFDGLVVLDEAYIDFSDEPSFIDELSDFPNLVVMQTFSKAWGLASLRLGMAFASPDIIRMLNLIKPPYNISGLTQEKVLEALANADQVKKVVIAILKEKGFLEDILETLPFVQHIYPSHANFLLIKVTEARKIYEYLIARTIIVRDRSRVVLCEDCLRISVGTRKENNTLLDALKQFKKP